MVAIRFDDFEVEPYGDCKFDYLSVHDGNSTSSPLIEFLCGISPRGTTLQSTGNVMTLHFFADAFGSKYKGFEIYATGRLASLISVTK